MELRIGRSFVHLDNVGDVAAALLIDGHVVSLHRYFFMPECLPATLAPFSSVFLFFFTLGHCLVTIEKKKEKARARRLDRAKVFFPKPLSSQNAPTRLRARCPLLPIDDVVVD